jgi:hypothetical protein
VVRQHVGTSYAASGGVLLPCTAHVASLARLAALGAGSTTLIGFDSTRSHTRLLVPHHMAEGARRSSRQAAHGLGLATALPPWLCHGVIL